MEIRVFCFYLALQHVSTLYLLIFSGNLVPAKDALVSLFLSVNV